MMPLILNGAFQAAISFVSVIGFSIIFNLPRKLLPAAGLAGMLGWLVYVTLRAIEVSFIIPAFVGSFVVGIVGEHLATSKKHPAILFVIPGIIPFVPGYGIYFTMLHIIEKNFDLAMTTGAESLFVAISIACGIVLATSISRIIRPWTKPLRGRMRT